VFSKSEYLLKTYYCGVMFEIAGGGARLQSTPRYRRPWVWPNQ